MNTLFWDNENFIPSLEITESELETKYLFGINIGRLPHKYNTTASCTHFIEDILQLGIVNQIDIQSFNTKENITQYSATLQLTWNNNVNTFALLEKLDQVDEKQQIFIKPFETRTRFVPFLRFWKENVTWENNRPMTHLTIRKVTLLDVEQVAGFEHLNPNGEIIDTLVLANDDWQSLHIPIIPKNIYLSSSNDDEKEYLDTENGLTNLIENIMVLGKVKRIDFVDRDDLQPVVKAAFIHFENWYNNENTILLRHVLSKDGNLKIAKISNMETGENGDLVVPGTGSSTRPAFIVFKVNHRPIPEVVESELNIHQLYAIKNKLETQLTEKDEEIEKLKQEIENLKLEKATM
jgi:hypothetical protein